ncbi:hypothetical protein ACFYQT_40235 [Streptomyces tibetensis]|uniref:Uncharacterized protein n=1 Tax=Streptomyces tibetensis TaxID=2382123 RepID=A0ABW6NB30_9ACTN
MTLNFQTVDEPIGDNPGHDDSGCQCPTGDTKYLLTIEEGQAVLVHAACGKQPSYTWGDYQDLLTMDGPIPVTVEWMSDSGSLWEEPDPWVKVTATSVPEDVRTDALALSRKHAAERNAR